jgi:nucleolar GTP-binding protein
VGHIKKTEKYVDKCFQIVDTPGLLDRPLSERNNIERQAVAALTHLADIIVFMFDPSETCGYSLKDQKNLLTQMKKTFKDSFFIIIENKADVKKTKTKNLTISCENKEGIDILIEQLFSQYKLR